MYKCKFIYNYDIFYASLKRQRALFDQSGKYIIHLIINLLPVGYILFLMTLKSTIGFVYISATIVIIWFSYFAYNVFFGDKYTKNILRQFFIDKTDIERELIITDESIIVKDKHGAEEINWGYLHKIEEFQDVTIIISESLSIIIVPTEVLAKNIDVYNYIKKKINSN